jgi:hypothetical protein
MTPQITELILLLVKLILAMLSSVGLMFKWLGRIFNGEADRFAADAKSIQDEHNRRIGLWQQGINPDTMRSTDA